MTAECCQAITGGQVVGQTPHRAMDMPINSTSAGRGPRRTVAATAKKPKQNKPKVAASSSPFASANSNPAKAVVTKRK